MEAGELHSSSGWWERNPTLLHLRRKGLEKQHQDVRYRHWCTMTSTSIEGSSETRPRNDETRSLNPNVRNLFQLLVLIISLCFRNIFSRDPRHYHFAFEYRSPTPFFSTFSQCSVHADKPDCLACVYSERTRWLHSAGDNCNVLICHSDCLHAGPDLAAESDDER